MAAASWAESFPNAVEIDTGHRLLLGVGLNVLTRVDLAAPAAVGRMATSLQRAGAPTFGALDPAAVAGGDSDPVGLNLYRLVEDGLDLAQEWDRLNLLRDRAVRVALGSRIIAGKVYGIGTQGALCLHDGVEEHRLFGGQVLREQRAWLPSPGLTEGGGP